MQEHCRVNRLSSSPTQAEYDTAFNANTTEIADCDGKLEEAVVSIKGINAALDKWELERAQRNCPWYRFKTCKPPA